MANARRAARWGRACPVRAADAHLQRLDRVAAGRSFRAGQILSRHVPLPHRNLAILSLGLNYCAQVRTRSLAIGLGREDATVDPWQRAAL